MKWIFAVALFLATLTAHAFTVVPCVNGETGTCRLTNGSRTDVQDAINASSAGTNGQFDSLGNVRVGSFGGDGVYLPAGNFSWNGAVGWTSKNILIKGAGGGTCSPTGSAHNCSCNAASNTCITATGANGGGFNANFLQPKSPNTAKNQWRVSGIYVSSTLDNEAIFINSINDYSAMPHTAAYGWRIDHVTLVYPNAQKEGIIAIAGPVFGLIDHVNIVGLGEALVAFFGTRDTDSNGSAVICGSSVTFLCGDYYFSLGYSPGTANRNVTVEDSMFWTPPGSTGNGTMWDTYYWGMRLIFRFNRIFNGTFYGHWTSNGYLNGTWVEFNNNVIDGSQRPGNYATRFQGGVTGIWFNNTVKGFSNNNLTFGEARSNAAVSGGIGKIGAPLQGCDGSRAWDGNAGDPAAPGWPCLGQTGRGNPGISLTTGAQVPAAPSYPLYLWNNGTQDACAACTDHTAASCSGCTNNVGVSSEAGNYIKATAHPNGDVDYCVRTTKPSGCGTHALTYTPLTYPHPLQQANSVPSAPTNFRFALGGNQ